MGEPAKVIMVTPDELEQLVRKAVREAMGAPANDAEFIETADVAKLLGVSTKSVSKYVRSEGLPAVKAGAHYRFKRADVVAWLERRAVTAGAHVTKHVEKLRKLR